MSGLFERAPDGCGPDPELFPGSPLEALAGADHGGDESWLDLVRRAEAPPPRGRLGPYEILEESRGGGQGVVFRARQPGTERDIALKRLVDGAHSTPEVRRRFEREVETIAGLSHPGIVTVYGVEMVDDVPVLAMEWVEGEPLTAWASRIAPGSHGVREKLAVFLQVCEAVEHAHRNGVIHRDLKPANILSDDAGRARVLDFGIARRVSLVDGPDATRTTGFVGTPAYAAPEQFTDGEAPLDVRSDVYALGVVLYEMLTGKRPFRAERLRDLIDEIERRDPARPSSLADGIGRDLDSILGKAMAKRQEERYQAVHALAEDVRRFVAGRPVLATPQSARYLVSKWMQRNRLASALAAACIALAVIFVAVGAGQMLVIAAERDEAQAQRERAEEEVRRANAVQDFYLDAILQAATPYNGVGSTDVIDVLEHAVAGADRHFGEHPEAGVMTRAHMAHAFASMGRGKEAEQLLRDAEQRYASLAEQTPAARALLLHTRGRLLGTDRKEEAIEALQEAVAIYETLSDARATRDLATSLSTLGTLEWHVGRAEDSERHLRESLRLSKLARSEHATLTTVALLGPVLAGNGKIDEAKTVLREAVARATEVVNSEDLLMARLAKSLAVVHELRGEQDEALRLRTRSLAIREKLYPATHPHLAKETWDLAWRLRNAGRCEEALAVYGKAAKYESDPRTRAASIRGQGQCLTFLRRFDEADPAFARAWSAYGGVVAPGDRARPELLIEWLDVLVRGGKPERANKAFRAVAREMRSCARLGTMPGDRHCELLLMCADDAGLRAEADNLLAEVRETIAK